MKNIFHILTLLTSINIYAQKKVLDHDDFDIWNGIQNTSIDSKGDYVIYSLQRGEKDKLS
jgi:predicted membrane protein